MVEKNISEDLIKIIKDNFGILCTLKENDFFTENCFYNLETKFNNFKRDYYNLSLIYASNGLLNYIMETQNESL